MADPLQAPRRDFTAAPLRGRLEAWLLASADTDPEEITAFKAAAIGGLHGTVVELGPGPGANMRHYGPDVTVIAIEPNPAMHSRLQQEARREGVTLEVRTIHGEDSDLPDQSADAVVGTLLLCGVDDPSQVLAEIRRILKPGGTYVFYEHVRAAPGSIERLAQRVVSSPHRWLFNGCELDRDTTTLLRTSGFRDVEITAVDVGLANGWTRSRIYGTARA